MHFSDGTHPLAPFLKPGFGHVWATQFYPTYILVVHPANDRLQVGACDYDSVGAMLEGSHTSVTSVVAMDADLYRVPGPFNCVEVIKALLGVRNPLIITPYQLYRHLTNGRQAEEGT